MTSNCDIGIFFALKLQMSFLQLQEVFHNVKKFEWGIKFE